MGTEICDARLMARISMRSGSTSRIVAMPVGAFRKTVGVCFEPAPGILPQTDLHG